LTPELREYAETPDRYSCIAAGGIVQRFADDRVCILQGPTWASVSGVRVDAEDVGSVLEEVRTRVPAEKEPVWWMGPSAQPRDLHDRLQELGLREPRDSAVLLHALVLTEEPIAPEGITVDRIDTYKRYVAAKELQWDAFATPEDRRAKDRARLRADFEESQRVGIPLGFLAVLDGRPAGTAIAIPSDRGVFLIGGSTAEWARGRGVYRGLIRARWEYAVERGTPALVVQAVPDTSYPILKRLGFQEVCTIRRLQDRV
jgi:hypothetical protein